MKVESRESAIRIVNNARASGKIIGFTSGVFDLLHSGHCNYLKKSRELCDFLVVAINSDGSVQKNKGPFRPIVKEPNRSEVISALGVVDLVYVFEEANNNKNIEELKPDIYFKAAQYTKDKLSSAALIEAYGGKVVLIPMEVDTSSTAIIKAIQSLPTT